MARRLRSPIKWFGGKGKMVAKLLKLIPSHLQYCELYFGGGSVFFAKEPCSHETINDADEGVTGFFLVLRDRGEEFVERCKLTEYGEALYYACRDTWREEPDELLRAWKWFVVARQSFAGRHGAGFGHTRRSRRAITESCGAWLSLVDMLPDIVHRLQRTQILCGDAIRALRCCDTPDCFAYLDPPYVTSTRKSGSYAHEMTDDDHRALVAYLLDEWTGKAMLSGYPNAIYTPLEQAGWQRIEYHVSCRAAGRVRGSGLTGLEAATSKQPRTECVWLCPRTAEEVLHGNQLQLCAASGG